MEVWQRSRTLSNKIYHVSSEKTFKRDFSLKDQINRASGSIMDNIAEGFERGGNLEFINFLTYSKGSSGEVQSQLYRALDREHITQQEFDELIVEAQVIGRELNGFITYLKGSNLRGFKFKDRKLK